MVTLVGPHRVLFALACAFAFPALGQAPAAHWTYEGEHGPA